MRELIEELRPKDYFTIALLIGLVAILSQRSKIIKYINPKHTISNYPHQRVAKTIKIEPTFTKKENLDGSKLKSSGYKLQAEYEIDSETINSESIILYNQYKVSKHKIDSIMNSANKKVKIRISDKQKEKYILDITK